MSLILDGTNGLSDVDGSASTPAIRGTDTNTGIFFPAADTIAFAEGGAEVARFDSSGNLGIGVTPSAWSLLKALQIQNASFAGLSNTTYVGSNVYFDGSNFKYISTANSALYTLNNTAGQHQWSTAASGTAGTNITYNQAMTLDASGNLLVNTTAVRNSGRISVDFNGATAGGMGINDANSVNAGVYIGFLSGGTFRGNITNNNNTSVSYNTTSDYRLKDNIAPMTGALAKVQALKPVTYTWKESGIESQGFIAHELAEVCPDAVTGEKDAVDAEGNPQYQGIDTSFLVATLTAAIQELKAELDSVKAELATLKA